MGVSFNSYKKIQKVHTCQTKTRNSLESDVHVESKLTAMSSMSRMVVLSTASESMLSVECLCLISSDSTLSTFHDLSMPNCHEWEPQCLH